MPCNFLSAVCTSHHFGKLFTFMSWISALSVSRSRPIPHFVMSQDYILLLVSVLLWSVLSSVIWSVFNWVSKHFKRCRPAVNQIAVFSSRQRKISIIVRSLYFQRVDTKTFEWKYLVRKTSIKCFESNMKSTCVQHDLFQIKLMTKTLGKNVLIRFKFKYFAWFFSQDAYYMLLVIAVIK